LGEQRWAKRFRATSTRSPSRRGLYSIACRLCILDLYPEAEVYISYQMPTYKVGKARVYLGLWKSGVSLHAVSVETFTERHPSIKTGRGSLNFKVTDELPDADIRDVVKQAISR
jgi:uncharacterized protein YdhG (YjbR/CyaY superfamily)